MRVERTKGLERGKERKRVERSHDILNVPVKERRRLKLGETPLLLLIMNTL